MANLFKQSFSCRLSPPLLARLQLFLLQASYSLYLASSCILSTLQSTLGPAAFLDLLSSIICFCFSFSSSTRILSSSRLCSSLSPCFYRFSMMCSYSAGELILLRYNFRRMSAQERGYCDGDFILLFICCRATGLLLQGRLYFLRSAVMIHRWEHRINIEEVKDDHLLLCLFCLFLQIWYYSRIFLQTLTPSSSRLTPVSALTLSASRQSSCSLIELMESILRCLADLPGLPSPCLCTSFTYSCAGLPCFFYLLGFFSLDFLLGCAVGFLGLLGLSLALEPPLRILYSQQLLFRPASYFYSLRRDAPNRLFIPWGSQFSQGSLSLSTMLSSIFFVGDSFPMLGWFPLSSYFLDSRLAFLYYLGFSSYFSSELSQLSELMSVFSTCSFFLFRSFSMSSYIIMIVSSCIFSDLISYFNLSIRLRLLFPGLAILSGLSFFYFLQSFTRVASRLENQSIGSPLCKYNSLSIDFNPLSFTCLSFLVDLLYPSISSNSYGCPLWSLSFICLSVVSLTSILSPTTSPYLMPFNLFLLQFLSSISWFLLLTMYIFHSSLLPTCTTNMTRLNSSPNSIAPATTPSSTHSCHAAASISSSVLALPLTPSTMILPASPQQPTSISTRAMTMSLAVRRAQGAVTSKCKMEASCRQTSRMDLSRAVGASSTTGSTQQTRAKAGRWLGCSVGQGDRSYREGVAAQWWTECEFECEDAESLGLGISTASVLLSSVYCLRQFMMLCRGQCT